MIPSYFNPAQGSSLTADKQPRDGEFVEKPRNASHSVKFFINVNEALYSYTAPHNDAENVRNDLIARGFIQHNP